jgi:uncharacterized protein (TIGR00369 family)
MTPSNPKWEAVLREGFARQAAMSLFGARIGRVAPGEIEIVLPFKRDVTQQTGSVHAGVIAAIADSACGGAAFSLMPPGSDVVSIEFKLNLLAPAIGDAFAARARVVRSGKTISTCVADVYAIRGDAETLVATMLATMMRRNSASSGE